jgi:N-acetylmuramoyl-L-alanine amidase
MGALITNAWSGWLPDPLTGRHLSRVIVEGCGELTGYLRAAGPGRIAFVAPAARLNLDPVLLPVHDGLVEEVELAEAAGGGVTVEVRTAGPSAARLTLLPGTPARAILDFPMTPLVQLFSGRVFVVDAGHGGADAGGLGPIDLLEKNVVLDMALRLEKLLERVGAVPLLTRRTDAGPTPAERLRLAREARPAAVVSLHTHAAPDLHTRGFAVFAHGDGAHGLAEALETALAAKLSLKDRGRFPAAGPPLSPAAHRPGTAAAEGRWSGPPAATIETVTISNPTEEGWLRSYVFRQRVAQGIFNGLAGWLRVAGAGPKA